jgi:hypothetical protein
MLSGRYSIDCWSRLNPYAEVWNYELVSEKSLISLFNRMQGNIMTKKFNQVWISQTDLGKKFGLSTVNIGEILIEHQLKGPKSGGATQKAIEGGYAKSTPLKSGTPFLCGISRRQKS